MAIMTLGAVSEGAHDKVHSTIFLFEITQSAAVSNTVMSFESIFFQFFDIFNAGKNCWPSNEPHNIGIKIKTFQTWRYHYALEHQLEMDKSLNLFYELI